MDGRRKTQRQLGNQRVGQTLARTAADDPRRRGPFLKPAANPFSPPSQPCCSHSIFVVNWLSSSNNRHPIWTPGLPLIFAAWRWTRKTVCYNSVRVEVASVQPENGDCR